MVHAWTRRSHAWTRTQNVDTCLTVDSKNRVKKYHGHPIPAAARFHRRGYAAATLEIPPPRQRYFTAAGVPPRRRRGLEAPRRYHGQAPSGPMKLSGAGTLSGMVRALVISSAANIFYHESMHHGAPTRGSAVPRVVQNTKRGLPLLISRLPACVVPARLISYHAGLRYHRYVRC